MSSRSLNSSYIHVVTSNMLPLHSLIVLSASVIHIKRDQIGQNFAKEQICMTVMELMT